MTLNPASQSDIFVAFDIVPVTPSDTIDLATPARAIRAQTGGTIRITTFLGNVRNTTIGNNEVLMVYASRIHETGTTAANIEALV